MKNPAIKEAYLLPIDQIRIAEAEITRKLAAAREEREQILADANAQATEIMAEAEENGRREGKNQYLEIVSKAEEEAKAIVAEANYLAKELHRKGSRHMDMAVQQVVQIVMGM